MQMTWADKMERKMEAKISDRLRGTVIRMLGQRFGTVPTRVAKRLEAIRSFDKLEAMALRIFEVQSLDELGLGGSATS